MSAKPDWCVKLIDARENAGLSQSAVAKLFHVTKRMWQYYEAAKYRPNTFVLSQYMRKLKELDR